MPLVIDVILKLKVSGVYTEFLLSKDIFWKKKKGIPVSIIVRI